MNRFNTMFLVFFAVVSRFWKKKSFKIQFNWLRISWPPIVCLNINHEILFFRSIYFSRFRSQHFHLVNILIVRPNLIRHAEVERNANSSEVNQDAWRKLENQAKLRKYRMIVYRNALLVTNAKYGTAKMNVCSSLETYAHHMTTVQIIEDVPQVQRVMHPQPAETRAWDSHANA